MLPLLSGFQENLQLHHSKPFFAHSCGLSDCDMEGVAILKVGQAAHLTSFPSTLPESLLAGAHLKTGFRFFGEAGAEVFGDQSGRGSICDRSTTPDWNQLEWFSISQGKEISANLALHWGGSPVIIIIAHNLIKTQISLHIYTG